MSFAAYGTSLGWYELNRQQSNIRFRVLLSHIALFCTARSRVSVIHQENGTPRDIHRMKPKIGTINFPKGDNLWKKQLFLITTDIKNLRNKDIEFDAAKMVSPSLNCSFTCFGLREFFQQKYFCEEPPRFPS
eukprot:TRINITY_DN991_c0_g1_i3.p2 TRINITY_DN991_c0_g1~~TRINITY_DN991_c0_g1_i3.p2  ORF type:complete len:132 (+),score=8.25 TRINITY_DN991_c0_g1_i3:266-661(+)